MEGERRACRPQRLLEPATATYWRRFGQGLHFHAHAPVPGRDTSTIRASALQGQIRDQLSDSLNTATYRFTWVATVFLPLSFLTGLLGINVAGIPGDHDPLAFWLVCGVLCVVAAAWGIAVGRVTSPFRGRRGPGEP